MTANALGQTGLMLTPISLGASSLGGGVFGPVAQQDAIRTVHVALDHGVRLIDVAPFYGETRAESVLGKGNFRGKDEPLDEGLLALVQRTLAPIHNVTWTTGRPDNN